MSSSHLCVDARMIDSSGIGRYMRNVLPGVIESLSRATFTLIGDRRRLETFNWTRSDHVRIIHCEAPIYSIREQIELPLKIPRETTLFWATNYNIPLFYSGPMLVTVYDVFHLAMPELVGGYHKKIYAKIMFSAIKHKSDAVITISKFSKRELIRLTGYSPDKIFPIHLGVDNNLHKGCNKTSPSQRRPYILFVGNVKPHKNLSNLVLAFQRIVKRIPHDLVIVGQKEGFITGDKRAKNLADEFEGRVKFTGKISDEELCSYYENADLFVFPSLYEGFGLPPLEAMYFGCPVLASNTASIPEILGSAAEYFDPHDVVDMANRMVSILENEDMRTRLKAAGEKRVLDLFSWDDTVKSTISVLESMLAS